MLTLAKNIVYERAFLTQIRCQVPEPPVEDEVDLSKMRTQRPSMFASALESCPMEFDKNSEDPRQITLAQNETILTED